MNLQKDHAPLNGNWWDPLKPTIKWHGTLHLKTGKRAVLKVADYSKSSLQFDIRQPQKGHEILHGTTREGTAITLSQSVCFQQSQSLGSDEAKLDVHQVIIGAHLSAAELTFDEVQVEMDYLNDWISYSRYEERDISDDKDQKEIRIRLNQRHQFPFEAPDYEESLFYLGYRTKSSAFKFLIESRGNLRFRYSKKQSLNQILKELRQWTWFLTLATRRKASLLRISVHREDVRFDLGDESFKTSLELWVPVSGKRKKTRTLHRHDMNFALPDIEKELSSVISRWKQMQVPWAATLHRYFASIHRPDLQLPEMFLFRAQALEAYHRLSATTQEVGQRETFGEAWEKAPRSLQVKLGSKTSFIESVRNNRNYLTHYNPRDEKMADDFETLFELNQKLGFLLEALILGEMGLSDSVIENALSAQRWGHLIKWDAAE